MEQQTADREANLEEKIAKVNSYLSSLSPSIGDFDVKWSPQIYPVTHKLCDITLPR